MSENYQVQNFPLSRLRPDPKQPRKYFADDHIEQLAESIKQTGLIKPIEIDPKGIIITGEFRWRAARKAGLKEIPCRVLTLTSEKRSERQLHENIHHYPMSPIETAKAIRSLHGAKVEASKIARILGKPEQWVRDHLNLLEMPKSVQTSIQMGKTPLSGIPSIVRVHRLEDEGEVKPGTAQKYVEKIVKGELKSQHVLDRVARAIHDNPGAASDYLKQNFKGKGEMEVQAVLDRVAPTFLTQKINNDNAVDSMQKAARHLTKRLDEYAFDDLGIDRTGLLKDLKELKHVMSKWHPTL
jgi:ParB family chromosome partitioning protein